MREKEEREREREREKHLEYALNDVLCVYKNNIIIALFVRTQLLLSYHVF